MIDTQRQQTQAALAQAEADREQARLNIGYTELRSPVDGYVGNRRAKVGAFAASGSQLISVVPAHGLWVDANFKEDQLANMQVGQTVSVTADILPGHTFHGRIESIAPATGAQFSVLPPRMLPATSPRSCSACRCGCALRAAMQTLAPCARAFR